MSDAAPEAGGFPPAFAERLRGLLGAETEACLAALAAPAQGLRVNKLRLPAERFRALTPLRLEPLAFPDAGFRVVEGPRPGKHPHHAAGLYYLQDPGAMAVGALVAPRPGERVLDLAAAPGGKATHLAALMRDEGLLVANDVHAGRARELAGNLERMGVRNAVVTCEPAERLVEHFGAWFDRVLLDAPCSGESMFHKSEAAREAWTSEAVLGCARRQGELLRSAARVVRPGGLLVYSTCTFSPEENEQAVADFLRDEPGFRVEPLPAVPGAAPGLADRVVGDARAEGVEHTLRLWPHRVPGAGHYVAALRREGDANGDARPPRPERGAVAPSRRQRELLAEFAAAHLRGGEVGEGRLELRGPELYRLPGDAPAAAGRLRSVRPGWWLGTLHEKRFEPSHALAMAAGSDTAARTLDLRADEPEVLAYLRGEAIQGAGAAGWLVVRVDGFPLGWGKRVGHTVKNHYPKGLRWTR